MMASHLPPALIRDSGPTAKAKFIWLKVRHPDSTLCWSMAAGFYDLDQESFEAMRVAIANGEAASALAAAGLTRWQRAIGDQPPVSPPVRALSLAVAQKCNLGCTYCYAREGSFGDEPKNMPIRLNRAKVGRSPVRRAGTGDRLNLAFLGGEPAWSTARSCDRSPAMPPTSRPVAWRIAIGFSITTNGTLLNQSDADFFEEHGFAVTVSLDGPRALHDQLRPYKSGRGSFDNVLRNVGPLLARQQRMQVSARVTVTPEHSDLPNTLDLLIGLGFHGVGFSPMLNSPAGRNEMAGGDLSRMLDGMVACGMTCERRTAVGDRYPFSNLLQALQEIHRGTHRPYPCGAGAGYLGVSADGDLAACHRFVGDPEGALGSLAGGIDRNRQSAWLATRHVHQQEPCRTCWARYLCGGGCHHEVIHRERRACEYIRGWICITVWVHM